MLKSPSEVIDALGGSSALAVVLGVGQTAVSNWRSRGAIPPEYFLTITEALTGLGKVADPAVFGFKPAGAREVAEIEP